MNLGYTRDFNLGELPEEDMQRHGTVVPNQGASKVFPQFYTHEEKDHARSEALGRLVHRSIEMIRIIIPGDRQTIVERRVTEQDKVDYHRAYEAFKKAEEYIPDGTRIESWGVLSRAQQLDLKALNIFTVEQIANLSDSQLGSVGMGARKLRDHAVAFLETTKTGALPARLVSENEELKNQVKLLMDQMATMTTKFEMMARKAGESAADIANPLTEARHAMTKAAGVDLAVEIPNGWEKLGISKLKELAGKVSSAPVMSKDDAIEIIQEYLTTRKSLAA